MKFLPVLLFYVLLFFCSGMYAQQNHFIYIQSENKQPFYAKVDKKVLSSSASGYLIIPKLLDGAYNISIGFPGVQSKEQTFSCSVEKKDLGYLLKNLGEKGWGIFNLQSLDLIMSGSKVNDTNKPSDLKNDQFSTMLSNVVNDPTIRKAEKNSAEENDKQQTEKVYHIEQKQIEEKEEIPFVAKSTITRINVIDKIDGQELIYIDTYKGRTDTVPIFIPSDTIVVNGKRLKSESNEKDKKEEINKSTFEVPHIKTDSSHNLKGEENKEEPQFLEIQIKRPGTVENKNIKEEHSDATILPREANEIKTQSGASKVTMINSDCKNFATEDDFLKLRKKIAAAENEEKMLLTAKKYFKTRCFTTEQIKNLGVLFLKDSEKYNFFDIAYPFVSDTHNYSLLENQLSDTYFINRFRVMIKH